MRKETELRIQRALSGGGNYSLAKQLHQQREHEQEISVGGGGQKWPLPQQQMVMMSPQVMPPHPYGGNRFQADYQQELTRTNEATLGGGSPGKSNYF